MEVDSSHIHNSAYSTAYRFGCRMFIAKHVQLSLYPSVDNNLTVTPRLDACERISAVTRITIK